MVLLYREKHINTDYAMTGSMLLVITHIREDLFNNSNGNHRDQENTVVKTLFHYSSEKELHENIDTFWIEYTNFNNNNDPLTTNLFGVVSISVMLIVICGIKNNIYHALKYLVL